MDRSEEHETREGSERARNGLIRQYRCRIDNSRYNDYNAVVKQTIARDRTNRRAGTREEAAFLDLMRTTDALSRQLAPVLKERDLSPTQYNVLRILRGAPQGLPCGEIGNRMITRDPDITRLLDRLEKRELISRHRETMDRRTVTARITPVGLKVLAELDDPVQEAHRRLLGHLGAKRLRQLSELLAACRGEPA
jgi:DNA-binding MarR family transcriptional regulator